MLLEGSFNNDRWSWKVNNEINILVEDDPAATETMNAVVNEVKQKSKGIQNTFYGPFRWLKIQFWQWFLYQTEILMSKNKHADYKKYRYQRIYNNWDDSTSSDF